MEFQYVRQRTGDSQGLVLASQAFVNVVTFAVIEGYDYLPCKLYVGDEHSVTT